MTELNLIPYYLKDQKQKRLKYRKYAFLAIVMACILLTALYLPQHYLHKLQSEEKILKLSIDKNAASLKESKSMVSDEDSLNEYINNVDELAKNRVLAGDKIKDIGKFIPGDIVLQNINYSGGLIVLVGKSVKYNSIEEFAANLQTSGLYKDARIVNIVNDSDGQKSYSFTINIVI